MKAKKYTNSSWLEGDFEKEYSTATDTYTTLPAEFQTSGADIVNYQVYGKTVENLFDYTATDTNNGYLNGYLLNDEGDPYAVSGCYGSEYIELGGNTDYTLVIRTSSGSYDLYFCLYDSNHNKSRVLSCNTYATFTTLSTEKYIRFSSPNSLASKTMLTKGSTVPTRYVPYGTPDGVGEETENLWDSSTNNFVDNVNINITTGLPEQNTYYAHQRCGTLSPISVTDDLYTLKWDSNISTVAVIYSVLNGSTLVRRVANVLSGDVLDTSDGDTLYVCFFDFAEIETIKITDVTNIMLVSGSTAPTTYIPFGYKIPILLNITKTDFSAADGNIEQGGWDAITGNPIGTYSSTTRVRCSNYVTVNASTDIITIKSDLNLTGYQVALQLTDDTGICISGTNWSAIPFSLSMAEYSDSIKRAYIVIRKSDNNTLVPSDIGKISAYVVPPNSSNYDLFLGDSKLYADEYLDFVEQKMYKYVSGVLTPTDPPAPFPTLSTYIGENNISVDTTVQPEKVALTVAAWREKEGKEYQNGEWSDNNDT